MGKSLQLNYLKMHRKRAGLSQRAVGQLLGFADHGPVSRHERSRAVPSLETALGYEVIFSIPVSSIFAGMRDKLSDQLETKLAEMEASLGQHSTRERGAKAIAQQLIWLMERRNR